MMMITANATVVMVELCSKTQLKYAVSKEHNSKLQKLYNHVNKICTRHS